jgi:hypothetical protein
MDNFLDETLLQHHNERMLNKTMATATGQTFTLRFRSKAEMAKMKKVARSEGLSLNTFILAYATLAADKLVSASMASEVPAQPTDGATEASYS